MVQEWDDRAVWQWTGEKDGRKVNNVMIFAKSYLLILEGHFSPWIWTVAGRHRSLN